LDFVIYVQEGLVDTSLTTLTENTGKTLFIQISAYCTHTYIFVIAYISLITIIENTGEMFSLNYIYMHVNIIVWLLWSTLFLSKHHHCLFILFVILK
jgi:hypothetical protein